MTRQILTPSQWECLLLVVHRTATFATETGNGETPFGELDDQAAFVGGRLVGVYMPSAGYCTILEPTTGQEATYWTNEHGA